MNPTIFFFFLILLPKSASTKNPFFQKCKPQNCSNLINVTFPFWFQNLQPNFCGHPDFQLQCENNIPKLPEDYHVLNISYQTKTISVSRISPNFASKSTCPRYNLSFTPSPFTISSLNRELIFDYNCTKGRNGSVRIDCYSNSSFVYLGGAYRVEESEGFFGSCYTIVRPVMRSVDFGVGNYTELLADGFLLNWTAPDCADCVRSNGQCGYDNGTGNFICICPDRNHLWSCSEKSSKTALKIGLSIAGGLCLIIFCSICFLLYRRCNKKQFFKSNLFNRRNSLKISKFECRQSSSLTSPIFSYDELYEATNGFDASKELGDGGFGTVYKGKLKDGRIVAVKKLYENNYRRVEQFMNEVKLLSFLRHPNLVSLYGCTSGRSPELLLVYEFVPNGTVADHLHPPSSSSPSLLPWKTRLQILIQTADALSYLHSMDPQIIHRDIKTSNILLDNNFNVKVADFGLSRLFPIDATHVSTAPQGTPGYVDPEYHQCYQLTDKSDVYSFGVVLMELISSLPAVDLSRERSQVNLSKYAIRKIQHNELGDFVDQKLGFGSDWRIRSMISEVAGLGLRCLDCEGELRPGMKEVIEILRGIERIGLGKEEFVKEDMRFVKRGFSSCSPDSVMEIWKSSSSSVPSFGAVL